MRSIRRVVGQIPTRFFLAAGLLGAAALFGYAGLESIIGAVDSQFSRQLDEYLGIDKKAIARLGDRAYFAEQSMKTSLREMLITTKDLKDSAMPIARGSIIGFLIGVLPGAGATIATFLAYAAEKRISKTPELFGTGMIQNRARC